MPEGVSVTTIELLGKDREFRGSLKTLRTVREKTGYNLLSPNAGEVLTNNLDDVLLAILFYGTKDHEGFESVDDLADSLTVSDIMRLTSVVFGALGLKVAAEKN